MVNKINIQQNSDTKCKTNSIYDSGRDNNKSQERSTSNFYIYHLGLAHIFNYYSNSDLVYQIYNERKTVSRR